MKPTNEQVLEWAREAGISSVKSEEPLKPFFILSSEASINTLAAIAYAAGAAAMQERCAKECEIEASVVVVNAPEEYQAGREMGATACAAAIRALGDDE